MQIIRLHPEIQLLVHHFPKDRHFVGQRQPFHTREGIEAFGENHHDGNIASDGLVYTGMEDLDGDSGRSGVEFRL